MTERLDGRLFGDENPCFGCAVDHPSGLRLELVRGDDGVGTRFQPRDEHQGPPGLVHGGLLMTLADEVAAWAVIAATGKFGFTVGFEGRILRAARIDRPLEARGRAVKPDARVIPVEVAIGQGDAEVLKASFRFALLDAEKAEEVLGRPLPDAWRRFAK